MKNKIKIWGRVLVSFSLMVIVFYYAGRFIASGFMGRYFKDYEKEITFDLAVEMQPFYVDIILGLSTGFIVYISVLIVRYIHQLFLADLSFFKDKKWF